MGSTHKVFNRLTVKETMAIQEFNLRSDQLRNLRRVMSQPMPQKKMDHFAKKVLPEYLVREANARSAATQLMGKRGLRLK